MTTQEACKIVDDIKRGYYYPRVMRKLAVEVLDGEALEAHGKWRDGEINLAQCLGIQSICHSAIDVLKGAA